MKAALISLGSESSKWTLKAMKKYFQHVDDLDIRKMEVAMTKRGLDALFEGVPVQGYDCIYAKGSFRYRALLRSITSALYSKYYMPVSAAAFSTGHNKLSTQLELQKNNVPMPNTYFAATPRAARNILARVNYPIVMKFPEGTQGKGVMFSDSFASASSLLDALNVMNQPFIIQEYIETEGSDIRAIVVGEQVVASMRRIALKGEVRSNIHAGGRGEPVSLDFQARKIAVQAAKAIGADICGVDILESVTGPLVIEVNLSPGLKGVTQATGIDVADKIAAYLYNQTKLRADASKKKGATKIMRQIEPEQLKEFITTLSFRGNRILLPETANNLAKFKDDEEVTIHAEKGKIEIRKTGF